ncbi:MAG: hypothetical protein HY903_12780 [Deltaproteobacteria bacterium]|nr:hypothetical protein [Deltaproteobacteria bacterium]
MIRTSGKLARLAALLLLWGCEAASDRLFVEGCAPGKFACEDGCCSLCRSDADCGSGTGCNGEGLCTRAADPCLASSIACNLANDDMSDGYTAGPPPTAIPSRYDAVTWLPEGFFGLPQVRHAVVVFDGYAAFWDTDSGRVTMLMTLAAFWDLFGKTGARPPEAHINSMVFLPAGQLFGAPQAVDQVLVTFGDRAYVADRGTGVWWESSVAALDMDAEGHAAFPMPMLASATLVRAGEAGAAADQLVVSFQNDIYTYDSAKKAWGPPVPVGIYFGAQGASGDAPQTANVLAFLPQGQGVYLVQDGAISKRGELTQDPGSGARRCVWTAFAVSAVSFDL